jgi:putative nucleotidyltransferase with HDIG domain
MPDGFFTEWLQTSMIVRLLLIAASGLGLAIISFWGDRPAGEERYALVLSLIILAVSLLLIPLHSPEILRRHSRALLLCGALLAHLAAAKALFLASHAADAFCRPDLVPFILPSAFIPILITVLLGVAPGMLTAIFSSLFTAVIMEGQFRQQLVVALAVGLVGVLATRSVRKRGQIIRAGFLIAATGAIGAIAFGLLADHSPQQIAVDALWAALSGVASGIVANAVLPILEWVTSVVTNVSWLELADLNHPLLQRMTIECPGTYHHALVVANLAEAAALAIGANALQCRVTAYFHDIGKLFKPLYFIENIGWGGTNPHDNIPPHMSALIVMAHVKEGVDLALKYRLPTPILDAIREHHGCTLITYFLHRARQQQHDALVGTRIMNMREEDVPEVDEHSFRYPGPRPQTRETAILMIADGAESASRSIDKPTPQRVEELVNHIVNSRIADGQFDECPITLKELRTVAERIAFTLKTMMHSRIAYPSDEDTKPAPAQPVKPSPSPNPAPVAPAATRETPSERTPQL